ncbi:MAG: tetratricopeptide repeat protein [Xanthomonadales bacterium]|nr:tetratricopeptide repeat protein [Xanthomonadales bacterium]
MDIYDQHEQSERVRSWLKDNASAILGGIVIGLGAIVGYHQWQNHTARKAHTAAALFEQARTVDNSADAPALVQLRSDFTRNGFAVLAAFEQAQRHLEAGNQAAATEALAWARDNARDESLKTLALLRLARLQWAAGQAELALASLEGARAAGFTAEREELRGDLLAALGRHEEARAAYVAAREAGALDAGGLAIKLAEYGEVGDEA